jgi:predicted GIY-YIG superfamily endonuclease
MTQVLYRHYDSAGNLLYVGVSLNALVRLQQHKTSHWCDDITRVDIQKFASRQEVLEAERVAITSENPVHNIKRPKPKSAKEIKAEKLADAADESRQEIVRSIAKFYPLYSVQDVARELELSLPSVKRLLSEGKLGSMVMGELRGYPVIRISGWQLIDFIEQVQAGVIKP